MDEQEKEKVFVKDPNKTYGLMEIVEGTSPMVEKAPEDTVETFPHYIILLTICSLAVTFALLLISLFLRCPFGRSGESPCHPQSGQGTLVFHRDSGVDPLHE